MKNWTEKKVQKQKKGGSSKPSPKKPVLGIKQPEQVKQQVTTTLNSVMLTHHNGVKQAVAKMKILE